MHNRKKQNLPIHLPNEPNPRKTKQTRNPNRIHPIRSRNSKPKQKKPLFPSKIQIFSTRIPKQRPLQVKKALKIRPIGLPKPIHPAIPSLKHKDHPRHRKQRISAYSNARRKRTESIIHIIDRSNKFPQKPNNSMQNPTSSLRFPIHHPNLYKFRNQRGLYLQAPTKFHRSILPLFRHRK